MNAPAVPPARRLLIVPSYLRGFGGVERWVTTLVDVAAAAGWEVTLAPPRRLETNAPRVIPAAGRATVVSAESYWRRTVRGRAWRAGALVRSVARDRRPPSRAQRAMLASERARPFLDRFWDRQGRELLRRASLVHVVGSHPFGAGAIGAAGRLGVPVLYNETQYLTQAFAQDAYHGPFRDVLGSIDSVLAHGADEAEKFRRFYGYEGPVPVVDQWIDPSFERRLLALVRRARRSTGGPLRIGSVSRLNEVKRLDTLIDAVAVVVAEGLDVQLSIAGEGDARGHLEAAAAARGIADRVSLPGFVPEDEMVAFYEAVDVFVLSSAEEGGPLTCLEAMAAGCAIVTTPVGAMADRVADGHSGLFFPVGDSGRLAGHLSRLSREPDLADRLGASARESYRRRNKAAVQAASVVRIWDDVSSRRGRS